MLDMKKYEGSPFEHLLSAAEAAEIWNIDTSTIRRAIMEGRLIEGKDCRKFGKQWVVTVKAMNKLCNKGYPWTWQNYIYTCRKNSKNSE